MKRKEVTRQAPTPHTDLRTLRGVDQRQVAGPITRRLEVRFLPPPLRQMERARGGRRRTAAVAGRVPTCDYTGRGAGNVEADDLLM
jgi:hypothetical protein